MKREVGAPPNGNSDAAPATVGGYSRSFSHCAHTREGDLPGIHPIREPGDRPERVNRCCGGLPRVMTLSALFSLTSTPHLVLVIDARVSAEEI
jgi:hypothetical protein